MNRRVAHIDVSSHPDEFMAAGPLELKALDVYETAPLASLTTAKTRFVARTQVSRTQIVYSMLDSLELCAFRNGPTYFHSYRDIEDLVTAATGLPANLCYLMQVGERRVNLLRALHCREGVLASQDTLPERMRASA